MNKKNESAEDKLRGVRHMIKNIAWNVFKNTGNIDTFLEFKQIKEIENGNRLNVGEISKQGDIPTIQKVEQDGNNQNQWYNNF